MLNKWWREFLRSWSNFTWLVFHFDAMMIPQGLESLWPLMTKILFPSHSTGSCPEHIQIKERCRSSSPPISTGLCDAGSQVQSSSGDRKLYNFPKNLYICLSVLEINIEMESSHMPCFFGFPEFHLCYCVWLWFVHFHYTTFYQADIWVVFSVGS